MAYRVDKVQLSNYGPIRSFSCDRLAPINLILGESGTGKTFLLKAIYSALRSMEAYKRGNEVRAFRDILAEKLRWTFQAHKLGDLVSKSADTLRFDLVAGRDTVHYQFSASAFGKIKGPVGPEGNKEGSSVFIPAREVFTVLTDILESRLMHAVFGYDDPSLDLACFIDLSKWTKPNTAVDGLRKKLSELMGGKVFYDRKAQHWVYKNRKNQRFSLEVTADKVKKIAALDILLASGYLDENSVLFFDDLDATLQPKDIAQLLDVIEELTCSTGIQVFITTGSYFALKKLALMAMKAPGMVNCICFSNNQEPYVCGLHDEMPKNAIMDTSISLYKQEIEEGP